MSVSFPRACALAAGLIASLGAADSASAFPQPKYSTTVSPAAPAPSSSAATPSPSPTSPTASAAARAVEAKPAPVSGSWSVYVVQHGDTLTGVGRRFGEPLRTLADLNELDAKTPLKAGSRIKLPPGAADAGKDPYASGPSPFSLGGSSHAAAQEKSRPLRGAQAEVEPVQKPVAVTPARDTPAREASAERPPVRQAQVQPQPQTRAQGQGQALLQAQAQIQTQPLAPAVNSPPPSEAQKAAQPVQAPLQADASPISDAAATAGRGRFVWPIRGQILMSFGPLAQGQRNDGVNIAADRGEEVKAAADGVVVYAGSEVKGYGNTVLIMHPGGWDTVYTHLDKIAVGNRGFAVKQGQVIGTVGSTGDVDQPQLHFETRFSPDAHHKYNPVDPLTVLPQ